MAHWRRESSPTWAITSYFDRNGSARRLQNFREFRRNLRLPLLAVELSYDNSFDLDPSDAELLIRVHGSDVLWQKERLLNLALAQLPSSCDTVAWLDCDIVFLRPDWASEARLRLEDYALVQPFEIFYHLPREVTPSEYRPGSLEDGYYSFAHHLSKGLVPTDVFRIPGSSQKYRYAPGLAWVARRELLQKHGLYDAMIIGGNDKALVSSAYGRFAEFAAGLGLLSQHHRHYCAWAVPFYEAVRSRIGYVGGDILHLWHGNVQNRMYGAKEIALSNFLFDPEIDIALNRHGVWSWNSNKPELHAYLRRYFENREREAAIA